VTPKAKWVLHDFEEGQDDSVPVETYDVRKVGAADVARLRWRNGDEDISEGGGYPSQVAVTEAGLYLLQASQDDAAVAEALKKKPSRSDPPKPYKGTKLNGGRYLRIDQKAESPSCAWVTARCRATETATTSATERCAFQQRPAWSGSRHAGPPGTGIYVQEGFKIRRETAFASRSSTRRVRGAKVVRVSFSAKLRPPCPAKRLTASSRPPRN
jgi:hypothetical protein